MSHSSSRTRWFWGDQVGPWRVWGFWYKQRTFIGVSVINEGEQWPQ